MDREVRLWAEVCLQGGEKSLFKTGLEYQTLANISKYFKQVFQNIKLNISTKKKSRLKKNILYKYFCTSLGAAVLVRGGAGQVPAGPPPLLEDHRHQEGAGGHHRGAAGAGVDGAAGACGSIAGGAGGTAKY